MRKFKRFLKRKKESLKNPAQAKKNNPQITHVQKQKEKRVKSKVRRGGKGEYEELKRLGRGVGEGEGERKTGKKDN